jgi:peptidylprolyl isomerase
MQLSLTQGTVMKKMLSILGLVILAACSKNDGKTWTTDSGLQITEVVEGAGDGPAKGDVVTVHYEAWVLDGEKFDSSVDRGEPIKFRVGMNEVLPGWDEGVATMKPGGKSVLIIPPNLAFGAAGRQSVVPPNASIKMVVELVSHEPGPAVPTPWDIEGLEVVITESGLKYVDIKVGDGEIPELGNQVGLHYSGYFEDGRLFDSSRSKGVPAVFGLAEGALIPGFLEGLLTMKTGGQRRLIIPPDLAYGESGYGNVIPPNSTLLFDLELLAVESAAPPKQN